MFDITEEPVESIVFHPENPNDGDVAEIRKSIRRWGWIGLVVVQRSSGYALVGENRLTAARDEGIETVPVLWADLDDDEAKRFMVAHNLTRQLSHTDEAKLLSILDKLDRFDGTGFSYTDYEMLKERLQPPQGRGGSSDDDGDGGTPGGGASGPQAVRCSVGPYIFTVEADVFNEFELYVLRESIDLQDATEQVAQRLGFTSSLC